MPGRVSARQSGTAAHVAPPPCDRAVRVQPATDAVVRPVTRLLRRDHDQDQRDVGLAVKSRKGDIPAASLSREPVSSGFQPLQPPRTAPSASSARPIV